MIVFNSILDILLSNIVIIVESFTKLFNLFFGGKSYKNNYKIATVSHSYIKF